MYNSTLEAKFKDELEKIKISNEPIKIKDSLLNTYIFGALSFTIPGFIVLFYFLVYSPQDFRMIQLTLTILLIVTLPIIMISILYFLKGMRKSVFAVSENKFEFYINNYLYQQFYWDQIMQIIINEESFSRPIHRYSLSYSSSEPGYLLRITGAKINNVIKLWCFPFNTKKQRLIIAALYLSSQRHNTILKLEEIDKADIYSRDNKCKEIDDFINSHKKWNNKNSDYKNEREQGDITL